MILVHGWAGPELTWECQEELGEQFSLLIPWRRGYPPNPSVDRQDFSADAEDLLGLANDGAHLVGFSYGGLGAAVAAEQAPERFASLTLIETPLWHAGAGDPEVDHLVALAARFAAAVDAGEEPPTEFLQLAGMAPRTSPRGDAERERILAITRGMRSPAEARVDLPAVGSAMPALVLSGGHSSGLERLCDLTAEQLEAERAVLTGAGHAVPRADGFNALLAEFVTAAEGSRSA